jgi:hypothetical protein
MLIKISTEKQNPLIQVLTKIKTTYFRTETEKRKGKWVYINEKFNKRYN